jgi:hypothetical protein
MPVRFERPCRERGCSARTRDASGYCELHRENNSFLRLRQARNAEDKKSNPVWRLYNCAAWIKRFRPSFLGAGNVICQRLEHGQRCRWPTEILHHLQSPEERPDLMYNYKNVVGLCRGCHPSDKGTPHWVEGVDYAPTILPSWLRS